jgi:uncharacterized membrane protein YidH (DUF202 family)
MLPIISGTRLTRKEDWDGTNSDHAQDLLFKVVGVLLGVATLALAYLHYHRVRKSRSDDEELAPVEASSRGMLLCKTKLIPYSNISK